MDELAHLVAAGSVLILSGAGLSTESGIPDYRGPRAGAVRRSTPMAISEFRSSTSARRRYWARSHLGWPLISRAEPNAGHHAVTTLHRRGLVMGIITQNVDGLHQSAGADSVLDLHGRLEHVICLSCGATSRRHDLQRRLDEANPGWAAAATRVNADGDVELPEQAVESFVVVACEHCGGPLKPDVVFFGENVPADRVQLAYRLLTDASTLMVVGSSLTVFSGRRFVTRAVAEAKPVVIVNDGPTRADSVAHLKLTARLGTTLTDLVDQLVSPHDVATYP